MAEEDPLIWLLGLDAKLDGAKEMIETLGQSEDALKKLDDSLKKTEESTKRAGEGHKKHAHEVKTTAEEVKHLREKLNDLTLFEVGHWGLEKGVELLTEALNITKELVVEAVNAAAKEERISNSFKTILGDEGGEEVLEYLDELSHHTEFSRGEIKGFTQDLLKAGFSAEQLPRALAATADLASVSKDRMEGAASALSALTRIQRTGKVMERSLGGLGIGERDLVQILKRNGVKGDIDDITKKLAKGEIDKATVLASVYQAITEKTNLALGGAGEKVGDGLQARLNRLKNLPEEYFEKWVKSPGFQVFSDRIDELFKRLDPNSPEGKAIFESLEAVLTEVDGVLKKLLTPEGINEFVSALKSGLGVVADIISGLKEMIDLVTGETLSKAFFDGDKSDQKLKGLSELERVSKDDSYSDLRRNRAKKILEERVAKLSPSERSDYEKSHPGLNKISGPIASDPADVEASYDAGESLGDAHLEGAKDALESHSPSKKMRELGRFAAEGFALGIDDSAGMVEDSFASGIAIPSGSSALAPAAGSGAGGFSIGEINVPISIEGGASDDALALAKRIEEILPSALVSALEQFRAELGS